MVRLVGWKALQQSRRIADTRLAGNAMRLGRARRWAREWRAAWQAAPTPLAAWRSRPDAGRLWFPQDALVWAAETCTNGDLTAAAMSARGIFDLLGSGPVALGTPPRWRRDLYSGHEWSRDLRAHNDIYRGDGSDVRTVWELSRCRHFLPLARAYARTGDTAYRDAFAAHVTSWIQDNPYGNGPHWLSPMDAGLRAANWIIAAEIFARDPSIGVDFWEALLTNLYGTGLFLERNLEWHPIFRGNHYVANGIGLLYLGAFFGGTPDGERWWRRGSRILHSEIGYQVGRDGVSFEASLAYHRLVTECFSYGLELERANGRTIADGYEERLARMYAFIDAYLPASGFAPMLGDADDGRLHAISAEAELEPRRHALGLPERHWPREAPAPLACREGGFFVLRDGDDHLVVRCGPVGLRGAGSHDHNDQLSFELCIGGTRIVVDSGTYAYTGDLDARFSFRSTAAHSVVQVGDEEQNPIRADRPWRVLADRTAAECARWEISATRQLFEGRHSGFAHRASGAGCSRCIDLDVERRIWTISDVVDGSGEDQVTWRLHLAAIELRVDERPNNEWEVRLGTEPAVTLRIQLPAGLSLGVTRTFASDRYGARYERPCLVASGTVVLPLRIVATFSRT